MLGLWTTTGVLWALFPSPRSSIDLWTRNTGSPSNSAPRPFFFLHTIFFFLFFLPSTSPPTHLFSFVSIFRLYFFVLFCMISFLVSSLFGCTFAFPFLFSSVPHSPPLHFTLIHPAFCLVQHGCNTKTRNTNNISFELPPPLSSQGNTLSPSLPSSCKAGFQILSFNPCSSRRRKEKRKKKKKKRNLSGSFSFPARSSLPLFPPLPFLPDGGLAQPHHQQGLFPF